MVAQDSAFRLLGQTNACRKSPLRLQQRELQQIYNNYAVPQLHDQKQQQKNKK